MKKESEKFKSINKENKKNYQWQRRTTNSKDMCVNQVINACISFQSESTDNISQTDKRTSENLKGSNCLQLWSDVTLLSLLRCRVLLWALLVTARVMAQRIPKALHHFRCYATILLLQETQTKVIQVIMFLKIIMGNQKKMLNYREKQLGHRPKMVHREHLLRNVSLMDSFTFFQVCVKTLADGQKNNET